MLLCTRRKGVQTEGNGLIFPLPLRSGPWRKDIYGEELGAEMCDFYLGVIL